MNLILDCEYSIYLLIYLPDNFIWKYGNLNEIGRNIVDLNPNIVP